MADNPDLKNDPNSPRNRAIETLQRIPVAGLEDLLKAKFDPEIWMWRVVLLLSIAVTIRYNVELTKTFLKYSTVEDFQLVVPEEAPFPFVYICAQHAINRTYATSAFPLELVKKVIQTKPHGAAATMLRTNEVSVEAFQEELLKFLSFRAIEEVKFDERLMYAYAEVLDEAIEKLGDQWPGWTGLLQGSSYQCESVVQECEYNGKPFSCCPIGQNLTSLQEADICFGISVSSVEGPYPKPRTSSFLAHRNFRRPNSPSGHRLEERPEVQDQDRSERYVRSSDTFDGYSNPFRTCRKSTTESDHRSGGHFSHSQPAVEESPAVSGLCRAVRHQKV